MYSPEEINYNYILKDIPQYIGLHMHYLFATFLWIYSVKNKPALTVFLNTLFKLK